MSNITEKIEYLQPGRCSSHLQQMFKGVAKKKMIFPAGVFLLKHREKGYILYDTGYSPAILKPNFKYWLYGLGTPVDMSEEERVDRLLFLMSSCRTCIQITSAEPLSFPRLASF